MSFDVVLPLKVINGEFALWETDSLPEAARRLHQMCVTPLGSYPLNPGYGVDAEPFTDELPTSEELAELLQQQTVNDVTVYENTSGNFEIDLQETY